MRYQSANIGGVQVFAVAGTHTVSFGISADATARSGLLGFGVERRKHGSTRARYLHGYKVFASLIPNPTPDTDVSTKDHPIQSLVWDDFTAAPNYSYDYIFHPLKGTAAKPDRSATPVLITVTTEPDTGGTHDIFFNRGVTGSQAYAKEFQNLPPEKQPTPKLAAKAAAWLSRGLDEALLAFIKSAKRGDAIRGAFYEFSYAPVLAELAKATARGVDVKLVVDEKVNEYFANQKQKDGTVKKVLVESTPRVENLEAIAAAGFADGTIIARQARKQAIAHNKFMVLLTGAPQAPTAVWTGSTNLTEGGIFGQANVGHLVRDATVAATFLEYWTLLAGDPGAATTAVKDPANVAFRTQVEALTPTPSIDQIAPGVTAIFSPRADLDPLNLYVSLLAQSPDATCATFAFGIPSIFKDQLKLNTSAGPLCFLLLESRDTPNAKSKTPFVKLNSLNNIYEASGSELTTPLGQWVVETDSRKIGLNFHVVFIHLKFLLHDPLGADPIVVTGSANFSADSTQVNDENMMIIRGDRRVADIYFTEFNRLWAHFQFRSVVEQVAARKVTAGAPAPDRWQFLREDDSWLEDYQPGDLRSKRVDLFVKMAID